MAIDVEVAGGPIQGAAAANPAGVVVEELPERLGGSRFLGQHALGRDLGNVGLLQVNRNAKPVHETGQFIISR